MPSPIIYLTEGARIFRASWRRRFFPQRYDGDAAAICHRIVRDCWNGRFFQTSTGNFPQFWTRDFGWCAESLTALGYRKEVHRTITYALSIFSRAGRTFTTITPRGVPFDFPTESVDSLPWLMRAIVASGYDVTPYSHFLEREISRFFSTVIDRNIGLVRQDIHFSSMKDFAVRQSSCYDNCMVASLKHDLEAIGLHNPLRRFDYPSLIVKHFWNGIYFSDDMTQKSYVAGDAQVFPFFLGIIDDMEKLKSCIHEIKKENLDVPFPLKYTSSRRGVQFIPQEIFLRNYESNAIWTHMGPLYIKIVKRVDARAYAHYQRIYTEMIEKHKNYLEVFTQKGEPYHSPFYYCDSGMLWAANYLTL
jgi:hypothetical protein